MDRKPTTLRSHRRRHGFSQTEVAYLLGGISWTKISRYEYAHRTPHLRTALACQIIFGIHIHELFPGVYEDAAAHIKRRARTLLKELEAKDCAQRKRDRLIAIIETL